MTGYTEIVEKGYIRDWSRAREVNADFDKFIHALGVRPAHLLFRATNKRSSKGILVDTNWAFPLLCDRCRRMLSGYGFTSHCSKDFKILAAKSRKTE